MKPVKAALAAILVSLAAASLVHPALAKTDAISTSFLNRNAVSGYDTVAYFKAGKPVKGDKRFSATYQGATWLFSSAENRAAFLKDPAAYAPQYGGYCAWAVGHGYTASSDPEAWRIVNGKLYLNYDKEIQAKWLKDPANLIKQGDANWPTILNK
jgi:YHS domain-containing protein